MAISYTNKRTLHVILYSPSQIWWLLAKVRVVIFTLQAGRLLVYYRPMNEEVLSDQRASRFTETPDRNGMPCLSYAHAKVRTDHICKIVWAQTKRDKS